METVCSPRRPVCHVTQLESCPVVTSDNGVAESDGVLVSDFPQGSVPPDICVSSNDLCLPPVSSHDIFISTSPSPVDQLLKSWQSSDLYQTVFDQFSRLIHHPLSERVVSTLTPLLRWLTSQYVWRPVADMFALPLWRHRPPVCEGVGGEGGGGLVRALCWHPHSERLALLLSDDGVMVFARSGAPSGSQGGLKPEAVLRHRQQRQVGHMSWRPHCNQLALACSSCALIVCGDKLSAGGALCRSAAVNGVQVLASAGHAPVVAVQWCSQGEVLVTLSPSDGRLLLWHVTSERHVCLARGLRFNTPCAGGLRWHGASRRLLMPLSSGALRVWDSVTWRCCDKRLESVCSGHVTACCCSPQGDCVLLATSQTPGVFCGWFNCTMMSTDSRLQISSVVPLIDTTPRSLTAAASQLRVGGVVRCMAWEPSAGSRLALLFDEGNAVAVFSVQLAPFLQATPCGVIVGPCLPVSIEFQKSLHDSALLSICWSDGRVQLVPMLLKNTKAAKLSALSGSFSVGGANCDVSATTPLKLFSLPDSL